MEVQFQIGLQLPLLYFGHRHQADVIVEEIRSKRLSLGSSRRSQRLQLLFLELFELLLDLLGFLDSLPLELLSQVLDLTENLRGSRL